MGGGARSHRCGRYASQDREGLPGPHRGVLFSLRTPFNPETQVESKGGTLDVGNHVGTTKPNTTYMVVWALMNYLIRNRDLLRVLELSYKMELLIRYLEIDKNG